MTREHHPSLGASLDARRITSSAPRGTIVHQPARVSFLTTTAAFDCTSPNHFPFPTATATFAPPTHDWHATTAPVLVANKAPTALFRTNQTASSRTKFSLDTSAPLGCCLAEPAGLSAK